MKTYLNRALNFESTAECTEALITTSLMPLETTFPEECALIIDFSCTVWTKMMCPSRVPTEV